jgi:hypothetical protein
VLGPFAFLKLGPVRGAREAFAVGGVEAEEDGEAAFAERWGCCEGEAVLELRLGFRGVVDVAGLDRTQGFSARSCVPCARGGEKGVGSSPW